MNRTVKVKSFLAATFAASCFMVGCHKDKNNQHDVATPVQTASVQQGTVAETHHYSAELQPSQLAMLRFRVNGYVTSLRPIRDTISGRLRGIDVGDSAPQGAVLASLRKVDFTTPLEAAHQMTEQSRHTQQSSADMLRQSEAQLANDEANYIRAQHLYAGGAMTGQNFDQSKTQYESSLANRDSMRKQLEARGNTTLENRAQENERGLDLADSDLRAPFPGVVLSKMVDIGDYANNSQDAFRFGDTRIVKAVFSVPADEVRQLHLGDEVNINLPQNGGVPTKGKVTLISSIADQQSRLFQVQVSIPNPQKTVLVGTTGSLDIRTGLNIQLITVPFTALTGGNADTHGYTVFVLKREGDHTVAKLRQVYLDGVSGSRAIVRGGVQPNEQVIDRPSEQLRDGSTVVVQAGGIQ